MSTPLEVLIIIITAAVVLIFSFAISALVALPITGAIVRLRANYLPKGVSLQDVESEGGDKRVGPVVRRVWGMIRRVKRLEGWGGLYKGLTPYLASGILISVASLLFIEKTSKITPKGTYQVPNASGLSMTLFGIAMALVSLPCSVLLNRTIVTPHSLPYHPLHAARIILTPYERSNPLRLFLAPGLLPSIACHIIWISLISQGVKNLVVPELKGGLFEPAEEEGGEPELVRVRMGRLGVFLVFQALSTLVLCPLEVLAVRLSIQRNHGPNPTTATDDIPSKYAAPEEDVISLRNEGEPYTGLVDAARKIVEEEGVRQVYSAWVVTLFGVLVGVAS